MKLREVIGKLGKQGLYYLDTKGNMLHVLPYGSRQRLEFDNDFDFNKCSVVTKEQIKRLSKLGYEINSEFSSEDKIVFKCENKKVTLDWEENNLSSLKPKYTSEEVAKLTKEEMDICYKLKDSIKVNKKVEDTIVGKYIVFKDGYIYTTDTYRLHYHKQPYVKGTTKGVVDSRQGISFLIKKEDLDIFKQMKVTEGVLVYKEKDRDFMYVSKEVTISDCLSTMMPLNLNVSNLIKEGKVYTTYTHFSKEQMLDGLKFLANKDKDRGTRLTFKYEDEKIKLESFDDLGKLEYILDTTVSIFDKRDDKREVILNYEYMKDLLSLFSKDKKVVIKFKNNSAPVFFEQYESDVNHAWRETIKDFGCLLMPMATRRYEGK